jgi:hypothetical protein
MDREKKIGADSLKKVLNFLGNKPSKAEVSLIIWVSHPFNPDNYFIGS